MVTGELCFYTKKDTVTFNNSILQNNKDFCCMLYFRLVLLGALSYSAKYRDSRNERSLAYHQYI